MKSTGIQLNDTGIEGAIMDVKINPIRDASGKIVSGLVIGNTLQQNKALLLILHEGDMKFRPDAGIGIEDVLLSSDYLGYRHKIREHFLKDGLVVSELDLYENKPFKCIADYEK